MKYRFESDYPLQTIGLKVFMDASPEERARRRLQDPAHSGGPAEIAGERWPELRRLTRYAGIIARQPGQPVGDVAMIGGVQFFRRSRARAVVL